MSTGLLLFIAALALAGLAWFIRREMKKRKRVRLRAMRLSAEERAGLAREMPVYARLPDETRSLLDGLIHQFLAEIRIYGAGGLQVTDEMKRLIAAQACLLLVGRPERWYHSLRTIHLYPAGFQARVQEREGYVVTERAQGRLGESWRFGPVILSWRDAALGAANPRDGRNVVYHEFAHQLDSETGVVDGAPLLDETQSAGKWARVMQSAYDGLRANIVQGDAHFLDPYGATSPAEFFAVAVEAFFDASRPFAHHHPELHGELCRLFGFDPVHWHAHAGPA